VWTYQNIICPTNKVGHYVLIQLSNFDGDLTDEMPKKKKQSIFEKFGDPEWREQWQAEHEERMRNDPEYAATTNRINREVAEIDAKSKARRKRVDTLRADSASLTIEERAEAWLRFVLEDPDSFSDLEALVYLVSRGKNCDKEIKWTISAWREAEQRAFERCARGYLSFTRPDGTTEYSGGMSLGEARDITRRSVYQLEDFWKPSRGPYPVEATMLRVVDWCNISGYDKWWARFGREYKEWIITGPPEKPFLLWGAFDLCRSAYAAKNFAGALGRAMDVMEIGNVSAGSPWTDYREKQKPDGTSFLSYNEYHLMRRHLRFVRNVLPNGLILTISQVRRYLS
jgi:hypothetical protein